jgi:hypothetical protein
MIGSPFLQADPGPSATPAKTNGLTNAGGTAAAVNSLDEAQNSGSSEYPRRISYSSVN